jgi:hypothetical protein
LVYRSDNGKTVTKFAKCRIINIDLKIITMLTPCDEGETARAMREKNGVNLSHHENPEFLCTLETNTQAVEREREKKEHTKKIARRVSLTYSVSYIKHSQRRR